MKPKKFVIEGVSHLITFIETVQVKDGVECDVYAFDGDTSKDLAMVRVLKGHRTPLQKVLSGDKTLEGFIKGKGVLTICDADGKSRIYAYDPTSNSKEIEVKVGQTMQWRADDYTDLIFYEICTPVYREGRFKNLSD